MDWYYTTVYSISGALILIAILGIIFSSLVPIIDKWNRDDFPLINCCNAIYVFISLRW